ncbi:HNH endonuclease signature motif containing protein [Rhodococcus rhodochrous]|uniref:HNH endonuclease signature motif containing protein n=1 Tax=Rhodococcus rhodochrous TaxID=1829 RepID=UPI0011C48E8A
MPKADKRADIDAGLRETRKDEPDLPVLEAGLRAAKAVGVAVDIDGAAHRPPASALAVVITGFGPAAVAAAKPPPAPKSAPARSPLPSGPPQGKGPSQKGKDAGVQIDSARSGSPAAIASAGLVPDPFRLPVPPMPVHPFADREFRAVTGTMGRYATAKKSHPSPRDKAKEAQDAAAAPAGDMDAQAKAAKIDTMDAQKAGTFDKQAFIAAVKTAVEAKSPRGLEEADKYAKSGKMGEIKADIKNRIAAGTETSAKNIESATLAPPDQSKAVPKSVTPMPAEDPGTVPAISPTGAVPKPAPPEQLNLAAGKHTTDEALAEADVTESQLAESNEPDFQQALHAKNEAAVHADTAPAQVRADEKQILDQTRDAGAASTHAVVAGMHSSRVAALGRVVTAKTATKAKDEARRAEVTSQVQKISAATEKDVKDILDGIDPKVEHEFEQGERGARTAFEKFVSAKMTAYKKDRYGGWLGGFRWAKDKLLGMPPKINEFFEAGRELYLKQMDKVISWVADIVATDLTAAKSRIARGRKQVADYVATLPKDLKKVGAAATQEVAEKFDALDSDVDAKRESLVDDLASKYVQARKGIDERIEALQAENKGLVDKAIGAIKAVVGTIRKLAAMLRDVLSRAAGVVGTIIKAPVRFLGYLIDGVKGGILRFKDNILVHLKKGLLGWLFGSLSEAGIDLPETFDVKGILRLLLSIFGLTWTNIRTRLVKSLGEAAVSAMEKAVDVFTVLSKEGPAGLWQMLIDKIGDVKDMIVDKVKDFVVTKIIVAGITWLIGLLNPAAAFIKACKLIYDVVMFFVNNASRIAAFVETILDSVADIARGAVGAVVDKIENVLGQMVPLLIGFLASVLGVGGIGKKIREIVETLQKPVNKAVDAVIKYGLKIAGPLIRKAKGITSKVKAKILGGDDSPQGKQNRLDAGMRSAVATADRFSGKIVGEQVLRPALGAIRIRYGLATLEPVRQGEHWAIHGEVQRAVASTRARAAPPAPGAAAVSGPVVPSGRTPADPIGMFWYKPPGAYPASIVLNGERFFFTEPEWLEVPASAGLADLRRHARTDRHGREWIRIGIGSSSSNLPRIGRVWPRVRVGEVRGGVAQAQFRELLQLCGYAGPAYEADHVRDLQWGGRDEYDNLWPLDPARNNAANQILNQMVTYRAADGRVLQVPLRVTPLNLHFRIDAFG